MKKNDFYLVAAVLCIAFLLLLSQRILFVKQGNRVQISRDGNVVGDYPLDEDRTISIGGDGEGKNVLVIENASVYMSDADCPDKLCVRQKEITAAGESIICLPHRLAVELKGLQTKEPDTVAH